MGWYFLLLMLVIYVLSDPLMTSFFNSVSCLHIDWLYAYPAQLVSDSLLNSSFNDLNFFQD